MKYKFILPQEIYLHHLTVINKIEFSKREIDVVACTLSGRAIDHFLQISYKTVATHIRNITLKIGCNSRQGIIDFIESSDKLPFAKQYYISLLIEAVFEKKLKEISNLNIAERPSYSITYIGENSQKNSFLLQLAEHLSLAGIKTSKEQKVINKPLAYNEFLEELERTESVIYLASQAYLVTLEETHRELKPKKKHNNIVIFLPERESQREFPKHIILEASLDAQQYENYYFLFFDVLKKLLPALDLNQVFSEFEEKYHALQGSTAATLSTSQSEKDLSLERTKATSFVWYSLRKSKWLLLLSSVAIVPCLFLFIFYLSGKNVENSIRSDLIIPSENSLLHRPDLLAQIDEKFKEQKDGIRTVALVGIGGSGKTTLARQYARQQNANIVWEVNAETHESLKRSFENLAESLVKTNEDKQVWKEIEEIKNPIKKEEKVIQFVKDHLRPYSSWVLVFDNVEKFIDIKKYLPQDLNTWGKGKILLTTRDVNIQNNRYVNSVIPIGELSQNQKLDLFSKILIDELPQFFTYNTKEETKKFLEKIPSFPLDVSIAAYYLRSTKIDYNTYLNSLIQQDVNFRNIQENILKESGDYIKSRYSIITLSAKDLIEENKNFKDLLLFLCILDSQHIPKSLLAKHKSNADGDSFIYNLKNIHSLQMSALFLPEICCFLYTEAHKICAFLTW
ncbi:MAG: hypothetical protein BGO67_05410 [Alphaproteobacteria bacterium 41-28]|nr:MAG: hypothetical protein BGO67_05410 [Alphaproteobacteria bacterium 41-28]